MAAKQILFDASARHKILRGVGRLARAVNATLGPRGRNVAIDRIRRTPLITKDGVTVAAEIELSDPFENVGALLVKQVAAATSRDVGDGTTTAIVLAEAILRIGLRHVVAGCDPIHLKRGIDQAVTAAVAALAHQARPVADRTDLLRIATVSANGDAVVGTLIADAMERVGTDGAVTVEAGRAMVCTLEVVEGMQLDRGYLSGFFATSPATMEAELEDAFVLILEQQLSHLGDLLPLLQAVAKTRKPLFIIAQDVVGEALNTLVVNQLRRTLRVCAVKAPGFGDERTELLGDLAAVCGCRPMTSKRGDRLQELTLESLGRARRITVGREKTLIREGAGSATTAPTRARQLRRQIDECPSDKESAKLRQRLARLAGGIAVLRIGAATDIELQETMARAEDSLQATRAAVSEGIVAGGGVALLRCRQAVERLSLPGDQAVGASIVAQVLAAPLRVLCENAGLAPGVIEQQVARGRKGHGYNVATERFEDLFESGIVDPVKVTRIALQNAASIAGLLLTTECMLAEIPDAGPVAAR